VTQGAESQAARLCGAGEALLESIGATPTQIEVALAEEVVPQLRTALGEERFEAEWTAGRSETADEAIELALEAADSLGGAVPAPG
jgi:hypothetical protein